MLFKQYITYSVQKKIKEYKKLFMIEGVSGSGKTYLMQNLVNELSLQDDFEIFVMEGDNQCTTRDYYPIERCLSSKRKIQKGRSGTLKNVVSKTAKAVPFFGEPTEYIVSEVLNNSENKLEKHNSHLTTEERNIIFRIRHIAKKKILFYIENFHWWDEKSIALLYQILKERENNLSFWENAVFIINWTNDQSTTINDFKEEIVRKFEFELFKLNIVEKENYKFVLKSLGLEKIITNDIIHALYSITGGHLHLTKDIIRYINDTSIEPDEFINMLDTEEITILIEERLKNYGAKGEVVAEVLKYASIIGLSFTFFELEKITKKSRIEIQEIIGYANKLHFVEETDKKSVNFVHEIIRELFNNKLNDNKIYYQAYAECLKIIKPNDYITRAHALMKAGFLDEASLLYIIAYVKKLRDSETLNDDFNKELLFYAKELHAEEYIEIIKTAYESYFNRDFDQAIKQLEWIEDIYPAPMRAERDYLLAMCYTKKIDVLSRKKSVEILETYRDIASLSGESELWLRILSLQMISYIHINDKENAIRNEKELMFYLSDRISFDLDAEDKINILRRKSSAVHSISLSQRNTMKSVKHFGPSEEGGIPLNPIEYYFALNNHVANTFVIGEFEESFRDATLLIGYIRNPQGVSFPRTEVALNNFILSGVAAQKLSLEQGLEMFNEIFNQTKFSADSILMRINQAVLYASTNQLNQSFEILSGLKSRLIEQSNIELYYQYYVDSNLMVVEYLLGHKTKALQIWDEITYMPSIGDSNYYEKRHKLIKELFDSNIRITGAEWLTIIDEKYPNFINTTSEKSIGNGFLLSDIQFFSES